MPRPWKHSSGTFYLKQRVPADLAGTARGERITLRIEDALYPVLVGDQVKLSLRTKDPALAKLRYRDADDSLALQWQRLRSAPAELSHRQTLEIAGAIYARFVASFDEEPGTPQMWEEAIRVCVDAGATGFPASMPDEPSEEFDVPTLELLIHNTTHDVLTERSIRITDKSAQRLRIEVLVGLARAADDNRRKAGGDYGASPYAGRYPEPKPVSVASPQNVGIPRQTITDLFDQWRKARAAEGGSPSSARRWEGPIRAFVAFLGHDDAALVEPHDLLRWRDAVLEEGSTALSTFGRVHVPAVKAIYNHGVSAFLVKQNPALGITVRAPKVVKSRPKGFTNEEATAILRAANAAMDAPGGTREVLRRAYRWVPWLCAYSGARVGEIAQLRKQDVTNVDGVLCLRITPEAGTVKNKSYRDVPLHPHLIDMGFTDFVASLPSGPMFYSPKTKSETPWTTTSGRLANWVRKTAKVTDQRVSPNHGWRHLFRSVAMGVGIEGRYVNDICGHAHSSQGEKYGDAPISALKREIDRFPGWEL